VNTRNAEYWGGLWDLGTHLKFQKPFMKELMQKVPAPQKFLNIYLDIPDSHQISINRPIEPYFLPNGYGFLVVLASHLIKSFLG
jgi:hypothetical protein